MVEVKLLLESEHFEGVLETENDCDAEEESDAERFSDNVELIVLELVVVRVAELPAVPETVDDE